MTYSYLIVEQKEKVAYVTINNPSKLNALSRAILEELEQAFTELETNPTVRIIALTGEGKAFVAGADIEAMSQLSADQAKEWAHYGSKVFRLIEHSSKITIAVVNGFALGGGLEIAMACDLRIVSTEAKMGLPEVSLGIIPGFSGTQRLPILVGMTHAKYLTYTGAMIDGQEAYRIGLANVVVAPEELETARDAMIKKILKYSFTAQGFAKTAINTPYIASLQGIEMEEQLFARCFETADQKEGMRAFLNKEKPNFQ